MYNSAGTSTYTKFSNNNNHSRTNTHSLHPDGVVGTPSYHSYDDKEVNSMANSHHSRLDGRQRPLLEYTHATTTKRTSRLQATTDDVISAPGSTPTVHYQK